MKVFLIVVAVIVAIFALILSISAEFTIIYDKKWITRIRVLFIEKDIELSKILSFILFPDKAGKQAAEKKKEEEKIKKEEKQAEEENTEAEKPAEAQQQAPKKPAKSNPIKKIIDEDGIVGIMLFVSNLLQTAGTAVLTLIKGLHIYSLYVKIIVGGGDAADIGIKYGRICGYYYPLKGAILNGMKVDQYDDYIQADFIAPQSEYEFQFIGSINIALLLKVALRAVKVFVINFIKNK